MIRKLPDIQLQYWNSDSIENVKAGVDWWPHASHFSYRGLTVRFMLLGHTADVTLVNDSAAFNRKFPYDSSLKLLSPIYSRFFRKNRPVE